MILRQRFRPWIGATAIGLSLGTLVGTFATVFQLEPTLAFGLDLLLGIPLGLAYALKVVR